MKKGIIYFVETKLVMLLNKQVYKKKERDQKKKNKQTKKNGAE